MRDTSKEHMQMNPNSVTYGQQVTMQSMQIIPPIGGPNIGVLMHGDTPFGLINTKNQMKNGGGLNALQSSQRAHGGSNTGGIYNSPGQMSFKM